MKQEVVSLDAEYTMLRQEILNIMNIQNNYTIAMFTITVANIGIAYERKSPVLFLLPYVILFAFQKIIFQKRDSLLRIAAYIVVYLENGNGWESNYENIVKEMYLQTQSKFDFANYINVVSGRSSSLLLGLVCSISSIIMCFAVESNLWKIKNFITIIGAIFLFIGMYYFNINMLNMMNKRYEYINALKKIKGKRLE